MKKIIIVATVALMSATSAFAALPKGCNPAIQNWENGSKITCPIESGGKTQSQMSETTPPTPSFTPAPLNDSIR